MLSADTILVTEKTGSYNEFFIHNAHYWETSKIRRHFFVENALVNVPNLLTFRHKAQEMLEQLFIMRIGKIGRHVTRKSEL